MCSNELVRGRLKNELSIHTINQDTKQTKYDTRTGYRCDWGFTLRKGSKHIQKADKGYDPYQLIKNILYQEAGFILRNVELLNKDCLLAMKEMNDDTVDLTITSPPYDDLRKYVNGKYENNDIWKGLLK